MKIRIFLFFLLYLFFQGPAQNSQDLSFIRDTMTHPSLEKVLDGEYLETTLKNQSVVRFYKATDGKIYLRLIVTKNFYFDKVDVLEIQSGTKSYYAKNTRQFKVTKNSGLFLIEVYRNYLKTIKDEGMTGIVFGGLETKFSNRDASQIKKIAGVFYDSLAPETSH